MLKEIVRYPLQIKGVSSSEFVDIKSPYSGEVIASVAQADETALKTAIAVAHETFEKVMRKMPQGARSSI